MGGGGHGGRSACHIQRAVGMCKVAALEARAASPYGEAPYGALRGPMSALHSPVRRMAEDIGPKLAGKNAEQAFFVRTGPVGPAGSDHAITLRIGFALRRASEFLVFDFHYQGEGMTIDVVPVLDADRYLG